MAAQMTFQRYELKYLLTSRQKEQIIKAAAGRMVPDPYGRSTIRNIYFDTDTYRLIRRSIEGTAYKEKLRIRSYRPARAGDTVFIELKKKYDSVVYKRRLAIPLEAAIAGLTDSKPLPDSRPADNAEPDSARRSKQIANEINYFKAYYQTLRPRVFLSYEREAFYDPDDHNIRLTFDENILARQSDLTLSADSGGKPLLDPNQILMEIKVAGGMPLWITHLLASMKLYKTSYSKYGTVYQRCIANQAGRHSIC